VTASSRPRRTASIPVIFLTRQGEVEDEQKGFDVGAVDFTKPISPPIVLARQAQLTLKAAADFLGQERLPRSEVAKRTKMRNGTSPS
jgi:putative two-component system response regulator